MRGSVLSPILLAAALAFYPLSTSGADQAPKRSKMACPELRKTIEEMSKRLKYGGPITIAPGSWGDTPPVLRKLPAGAELCGLTNQGSVIIASPLFGKALEDYYAPLFAEVGCKPFKCSGATPTNCTCRGAGVGVLLADIGAEYYSIMFNDSFKKKK